ncbi:hypothetical protein FDB61_17865 [Clostridium botulinum]|nr:hypothetical protein [Clostridium botulinum]
MNRKKIILSLLVICVAVPIFFIITSYNKNSNKDNYSYKKFKQVEEFTKKEKGTDPNKEITNNEGGYSGIFIKNKQSLLKVMNTDGMMSVNNMLNEAFNYIPKIHEDSKSLNESDISQYFNDNKDKIQYTFGIDNIETFSELLSDLNFIGEGRINEAIIDEDSVKKGEFEVDEVRFNLILNSTIGESQIFNIKFLIQENNQKDSKLIYWY